MIYDWASEGPLPLLDRGIEKESTGLRRTLCSPGLMYLLLKAVFLMMSLNKENKV
jgi:hypothetical protein